MNILALETSGNTGSVAVLHDDVILGEYTINYKKTHSQTLMPMVDELLKMIELDISMIDAFAISEGPGSFTGLRIGSATAKGFGLALNKPIINVSTIQALAYNYYGSDKRVCPIMDARRGQVYCGIYSFGGGKCVEIMEPSAMAIEELICKLDEESGAVIFLGDGVAVHRDIIDEKLKACHEYAYGNNLLQRASSVALLGKSLYDEGKVVSASNHSPVYLRVSQAERERNEKLGQ